MGVSLSFICRNVARSRSHFLHGEKYLVGLNLINIIFLIIEYQAHVHKTVIKHYNPGNRQCFLQLNEDGLYFCIFKLFL